MPTAPPLHRPLGWSKPERHRVDAADRFYDSTMWRELRKRCLDRDGWRCTVPDCKTPCRGFGGRLIADHIVPRRAGGKDELGNLKTVCNACHERITKRATKISSYIQHG